jgi:predicted ribosome quality control (RQC) complex YloA/Tae2 family protein
MTRQTLSFAQMQALTEELASLLLDATLLECFCFEKRQLILFFEKEGSIYSLLLCLQEPFLRFHLLTHLKPYKDKKVHSFLTDQLAQSRLQGIELLQHDRILQLSFKKKDTALFLVAEFFPKHPNYYLLNNQKAILLSLNPVSSSHYQLPSAPPFSPSSAPLLTNCEVEEAYLQLEQQWLFDKDKHSCLSRLQSQLKRIHQRLEKLQKDQAACAAWQTVQHEGELLKSSFHLLKKGLTHVTVWDWEKEKEVTLSLDPKLLPQEEVALRFRRSKKLEAGIHHLEKQKEKLEKDRVQTETSLKTLVEVQTKEELDCLKKQWNWSPLIPSPKRIAQAPALPYHEFETASGLKIWVGKNAADNERLTFSIAKGGDWWLHVKDYPGSHVVIRTLKGQEPDPESLYDAMQLALYYSKAKSQGQGEVCITQRKFVSRFGKGQMGKVQLSKHKTVVAKLDPARYEQLKNRYKPR